jgi:hypothetical protein
MAADLARKAVLRMAQHRQSQSNRRELVDVHVMKVRRKGAIVDLDELWLFACTMRRSKIVLFFGDSAGDGGVSKAVLDLLAIFLHPRSSLRNIVVAGDESKGKRHYMIPNR